MPAGVYTVPLVLTVSGRVSVTAGDSSSTCLELV